MRTKKTKKTRIGAVRAVPKPATRAEALKWAENLGFEALSSARGGVSGASRTHGGSYQMTGCCGWNALLKGGRLFKFA
jgi:hypothetical protein